MNLLPSQHRDYFFSKGTGDTALILAARMGNAEAAKALIADSRINTKLKNARGLTAYDEACKITDLA